MTQLNLIFNSLPRDLAEFSFFVLIGFIGGSLGLIWFKANKQFWKLYLKPLFAYYQILFFLIRNFSRLISLITLRIRLLKDHFYVRSKKLNLSKRNVRIYWEI